MLISQANERLMGEEIIAADEEFEVGVIGAQFGDESFGGGQFAILFIAAIGVPDLFGHQGDDLAAVGMHERGRHHLVGIRRGARSMVGGQTVRTRNRFRVKVMGCHPGNHNNGR